MAHEHDDDFYRLTFSQREGKAPLPEPMRLEHVPQRFRQLMWQVIDREIESNNYVVQSNSRVNLRSIMHSYKFNILGEFHDDIEDDPEAPAYFFKEVISEEPYHTVLTLIEFTLRHECCPENLRKSLVDVFDEVPVAYFVKKVTGCFTIMPRMSKESGEATQQAIQVIQDAGMRGALTHLRQAVGQINVRQFAKSIADSIHAVESVARQIDPKSQTLRPALNSLEKAGLIKHPALKEAFSKLYGYTSDEQGIRHALLNQDSADVGVDEAVFMFGACASFAAYLVNKHRQMQGQEDRDQ